jgi:hypothetical protein
MIDSILASRKASARKMSGFNYQSELQYRSEMLSNQHQTVAYEIGIALTRTPQAEGVPRSMLLVLRRNKS